MPKAKISVVLGTYNRYNFLKLTIENIRQELKRLALRAEIIVVDGGSTDGTISWLTAQKDIISIIQHNRGAVCRSWGYFMNLAFKCAQGKYVCMISDDCLLVPNAIVNGYKLFEKKLEKKEKVGALAFYWRNLPLLSKNWDKNNTYHVLRVFDKFFVNHGMYLRQALEEINYIDEETYQFYNADTDLCLRLDRKGYSCLESPNSYVEHYHYANPSVRNQNESNRDIKNFYQKWNPIFSWPTSQNPSSCLTKTYIDPYKTAQKFLAAHSIAPKTLALVAKNKLKQKKDFYVSSIKKFVKEKFL